MAYPEDIEKLAKRKEELKSEELAKKSTLNRSETRSNTNLV